MKGFLKGFSGSGFTHALLFLVLILAVLAACNQDKTAPEITILGDNPHIQCIDIPYQDAGATAVDDEDGDITSNISVQNNVIVEDTGTYTVVYTVEDDAGNFARETRIVKVIFCK